MKNEPQAHSAPAASAPETSRARRIMIVTDAWDPPQVNGVSLTYQDTAAQLRAWGHDVQVIHPGSYPAKWFRIPHDNVDVVREKGLAGRTLDAFDPHHVHIATEGPIGLAARRHCLRRKWRFTTAYHTQWPEYAQWRSKGLAPVWLGYQLVRRFHAPASRVMTTTPAMADALRAHGFSQPITIWTRGVDNNLFKPRPPGERPPELAGCTVPVALSVGRIAREKNIPAFLEAPFDGLKVVVGEGPRLAELRRRHPKVLFPGLKRGVELARWYAAADLFVFPSRTDTFGKVLIEALSCGTPVAAFDCDAPRFVLGQSGAGVLHNDLGQAMSLALGINPVLCLEHAARFSISGATRQFLEGLVDR
ncbi:MAG: glycosyltransferase family 1 protein [Magnetococcus sp. WYHC-3]